MSNEHDLELIARSLAIVRQGLSKDRSGESTDTNVDSLLATAHRELIEAWRAERVLLRRLSRSIEDLGGDGESAEKVHRDFSELASVRSGIESLVVDRNDYGHAPLHLVRAAAVPGAASSRTTPEAMWWAKAGSRSTAPLGASVTMRPR